jgi:hypothetical protein
MFIVSIGLFSFTPFNNHKTVNKQLYFKIHIILDVMLHLWVSGHQHFEGSWCLHFQGSSSLKIMLLELFDPEYKGINVTNCLPDTVAHPRTCNPYEQQCKDSSCHTTLNSAVCYYFSVLYALNDKGH